MSILLNSCTYYLNSRSQLKEKLEKEHRGKIVAIEIVSGDFFLGNNEIEAYEKAIQKYPDKTFVYKRIGYQATHFVGAF